MAISPVDTLMSWPLKIQIRLLVLLTVPVMTHGVPTSRAAARVHAMMTLQGFPLAESCGPGCMAALARVTESTRTTPDSWMRSARSAAVVMAAMDVSPGSIEFACLPKKAKLKRAIDMEWPDRLGLPVVELGPAVEAKTGAPVLWLKQGRTPVASALRTERRATGRPMWIEAMVAEGRSGGGVIGI